MKKTKIIGIAAAALLAVAPISTIVSAAGTAQTTDTTQTTSQDTTQAVSAQYTHSRKTETINPNNQTFQIAANSTFDPTNITLTNGDTVKISGKVSIVANPVDTSKAGESFTVQLSGENNTTISYQVYVKPATSIQLYLPDNQKYVKGLGDTDTFYQGRTYYVGNLIRYENGEFYTGVSTVSEASANANNNATLWIQTKYLATSKASTPSLVQKTVMHAAQGYTAAGTKTKKKFSAFSTVYVKADPIHIDGGQYYTSGDFYQVYNADGTYTNYYIRVSNIDDTKRTLTKNAYIYATSTRRATKTVLKKGTTITTYGGSYKFKNGKLYYRIQGATATNKRYVKVANFK
ncbi:MULTISPECIES: SLAP domain-containing protein [Lactobacillus]|uniref:SLAP domain-containing protein n=1 Tax=Lactobacillus TaxID=1578 RepID=UPI0024928B9A|nr:MULTISPECIES: SLAP domain-containing protein [Lactobacillus]